MDVVYSGNIARNSKQGYPQVLQVETAFINVSVFFWGDPLYAPRPTQTKRKHKPPKSWFSCGFPLKRTRKGVPSRTDRPVCSNSDWSPSDLGGSPAPLSKFGRPTESFQFCEDVRDSDCRTKSISHCSETMEAITFKLAFTGESSETRVS